MEQISIAVRNFNEKVKVMNQTNAKQLVLSADDARNLHTDIYALLANIAELKGNGGGESVQISVMDGGRF
jgi:hypothetical protein